MYKISFALFFKCFLILLHVQCSEHITSDTFPSKVFEDLSTDLGVDKTASHLIGFLQASKWCYFLETNHTIQIQCTLSSGTIYANDEEKLVHLLNTPWPLPIPFFFTHQKLWEPLLLAQKNQPSKQNTFPTLLDDDQEQEAVYDYLCPNSSFFTYLDNCCESTLLTILFNYTYVDLKINKADTQLIPTIELYLTKRIFLQHDYLTIIRQCLLNTNFNPSYYDQEQDTYTDYNKKEIQPFAQLKKLFMTEYPQLTQSSSLIENYFSFILKNPSTALPKIEILFDHLDLSNLDLSNKQLIHLFFKHRQTNPQRFNIINNKIQYIYEPKTFDPFWTLINFKNRDIQSRDYLFSMRGTQGQSYYYYLFFNDIQKLSLYNNPNLTELPLWKIRRTFPSLQTISIDYTQLESTTPHDLVAIVCPEYLLYQEASWPNEKIEKNILHRLHIILHEEDQSRYKKLKALYVNAYKNFFCYTNYFYDLNKEIMLKTIALFAVHTIANLLTECDVSVLYDSSIKKASLLLLTVATMLLQVRNNTQDEQVQKVSWPIFGTYWFCGRLLFVIVNYLLLSYYIKTHLTFQINDFKKICINQEIDSPSLFYFIFVICPLLWIEKDLCTMIYHHDQFISKIIS